MKYLKYFEKIKGKNVKIGEIYRIRPRITMNYIQRTIPLAKIIDKLGPEVVSFESYAEDTGEKLIFKNYNKRELLNNATPEEIDLFNEYEARAAGEKYNL